MSKSPILLMDIDAINTTMVDGLVNNRPRLQNKIMEPFNNYK
jgi:hypothetical protein